MLLHPRREICPFERNARLFRFQEEVGKDDESAVFALVSVLNIRQHNGETAEAVLWNEAQFESSIVTVDKSSKGMETHI